MAAISTPGVTIPRWLRRVERGESRLTTDIEAAYRRSDLTLWGNALYLLFAAISGFAHAWLHAHHDDAGWFSQALIFLPALLVLSGLGRTDERRISPCGR